MNKKLLFVSVLCLVFIFTIGSASTAAEKNASTTPEKPAINIQQLEKHIHQLVNEERKKHGLSALEWDKTLHTIAKEHSQNMAEKGFFSHTNPSGESPAERGREEGLRCRKEYGSYYTKGIAENIFQNNLYDSVTSITSGAKTEKRYDWNTQQEIAQSTVEGWMGSAGHRKNILNPQYEKEGIGVAISDDDKVYISQDFC